MRNVAVFTSAYLSKVEKLSLKHTFSFELDVVLAPNVEVECVNLDLLLMALAPLTVATFTVDAFQNR